MNDFQIKLMVVNDEGHLLKEKNETGGEYEDKRNEYFKEIFQALGNIQQNEDRRGG